jgi:hypothetical protein
MLNYGLMRGKIRSFDRDNELQISQGKYTLFSANIFVRLRALTESLKVLKKFGISERKVQIIVMIGS